MVKNKSDLIKEVILENNTYTAVPPACNESMTGDITFVNISLPNTQGLGVRLFPVNNTDNKGSINITDTAFCNMDKHIYLPHFPHYTELVLKCWSFFQMNPRKNKVLIYPDFLLKIGPFMQGVNDVLRNLGIDVEKYTAVRGFGSGENSISATAKQFNEFPFWMASTDHAREFRKQFLATLRLEDTSNQSCYKKIPKIAVIDRNSPRKGRKLLNVERIVEALKEEFGMEEKPPVEYFEKATFYDQVKFFSETDIVISSHGAQLTGMIFMPGNGALLELYPLGFVIPYYFGSLSASIGLDHAYIYETEGNFENETAYWTTKDRINNARSKNLCVSTSKIVEATRELVRRWRDRCTREAHQ